MKITDEELLELQRINKKYVDSYDIAMYELSLLNSEKLDLLIRYACDPYSYYIDITTGEIRQKERFKDTKTGKIGVIKKK